MQGLLGKTAWWLHRAVFGFYAFLLAIPSSYNLFGAAAASLSVVSIVASRRLYFLPLDGLLAALIAAFPLSMIPSLVANGGSWSYFDYPLRALVFIPLILGLRKLSDAEQLESFLYIGAGTGGLFAGIFSATSLALNHAVRVGNPITNPIPFGQAAAVLALLSFAGFFKITHRAIKIYLAAGYVGAIFAVYGSGSGGALLGLAAGLTTQIIFLKQSLLKSVKPKHILVIAFVSAAIALPLAASKLSEIAHDIQGFNSGRGMETSQGGRLILISIGLKSFYQHPWLGIGPGNGYQAIAEYCSQHYCTPKFSSWQGVHNQYLDILMSAGLVGIIGWLTFSLGTAYLFCTRIFAQNNATAPIAGLAIVIAMLVSAFPQPLYNHNISVTVFAFTTSFLWYASYPSQQMSKTSEACAASIPTAASSRAT